MSVVAILILEETKLTKKDSLLILLIAKDASDGILGLSAMICRDKSLIESITAANSLSPLAGRSSVSSETVAFR